MHVDGDFKQQILDGKRLITAEITYHLPDYPSFLQTYLWQDYDLEPKFPVLGQFLEYWSENIEGPLHSIILANKKVLKPSDFGITTTEFSYH